MYPLVLANQYKEKNKIQTTVPKIELKFFDHFKNVFSLIFDGFFVCVHDNLFSDAQQ